MRKEARYNLIFIVALLALAIPGVTMLVRKKIQEEGDMRGGMSAPVPTSAVYADPLPKGSNIRSLIVPPQTHAWAWGLAGRVPADDEVFISRERSFEVIDLRPADDGTSVVLLLWDARLMPEGSRLTATIEQDGQPSEVKVVSVEPVQLPKEIRSELQRSGYLLAPETIHRAELRLPPGATGRLTVAGTSGNRRHADTIDLETIQFERAPR